MIVERDLFDVRVIGWRQKWLTIYPVSHDLADSIIRQHHYSHKATAAKEISIGVYHNDSPHTLQGVMQLGYGIRPAKKGTWGAGVTPDNSLEFDRMWLSDDLPQFSESLCLSMLTKFLRHTKPHLRYILTYADGSVGNVGTIYRAGNYHYVGKLPCIFFVLADGQRVHPISMWHRHGTREFGFLQATYPGIQRAKGYQYRFMLQIR